MYKLYFKRLLDFTFSLLGLAITSPVIIILIFLLFITNGSVFFYQKRPGQNNKIFKIIKFKTMNDKKDILGNLLPDGERLTFLGKFIRKTSLDEIPQLINVLKGDMSLVGPRPLLVEYLPYYSKDEQLRHLVKPGITGLAQVSGRNSLNWDTRLAKDVEYVKNMSFYLDLKIVLLTIKKVFAGSDVIVIPGNLYQPLNIERSNANNC